MCQRTQCLCIIASSQLINNIQEWPCVVYYQYKLLEIFGKLRMRVTSLRTRFRPRTVEAQFAAYERTDVWLVIRIIVGMGMGMGMEIFSKAR